MELTPGARSDESTESINPKCVAFRIVALVFGNLKRDLYGARITNRIWRSKARPHG